jgi:uncharacterized repeat protein (TIGR01451 family)
MIASVLAIPMTVSAGPVMAMSVANENPQTVSPGSSVTYNLSVANTGDASAIVNLTTSGTPSTWTAQLSTSQVTVSVGNTATVYLTVGAPNNATADSVGKAIVVIGTYDTGGTNATKQVTTTTKVSQLFNFGISVEGSFNKDIAPGSSGTFTINVTQVSQGNGQNYINLTPTGQQPDGITLSYSANPATLQAFSYSTVVVTAYVPADTVAKQYQYTISANSQGGGQAQTASIIVNVTQTWGISLSAVDAVKYINPDSSTSFSVSIGNTGNKADTFDITSVDFLSPAGGWTETHTSSVGPLNPLASGTATVQIYAPGNSTYPTSMQLRINVVSDSNLSVKRNTTFTAVINKVNSTYVSADPFINTSDPGGTAKYVLQVKNTGNGQSTIDLTLPQFPSDMTPSLDRSAVDLLAGQTTTVNLTVLVGQNAPKGDSNVIVKATVHDTAASSNYTIIVRVNQVYNLTVFPSGTYSQHLSPGAKVTYGITVKNTGNGNDTITMTNGTAPTGMTVYFDAYSIDLSPGASRTFNATVETAKNTADGSYQIDLKGTSSGGKTSSTTVIVIVDPFGVQLVASPSSGQVKPGESGKYSIIIKNTGASKDSFFVNISSNPNNWGSLDLSSPFVSIEGGSFTSCNLTVSVPLDAAVVNVTTVVLATSQGNTSVSQSANVVTSVTAIYNMELIVNNLNASVEPSDTTTYEVRVKNTGNTLDTFNFDVTGEKRAWGTMNASSAKIASGASTAVTISVTVPNNEQPASWSIAFKATSLGNTSRTEQVTLNITVKQKHDLDLSAGDFIVKKKGEPGTKVVFKVNVTNLGPDSDTVVLALAGTHLTWASLAQDSAQLGASASQVIDLTVTIPSNAVPESFDIKVTGTLKSNTNRTKSLDLTLTVGQIYKMEISSQLAENSTSPGGVVGYVVKLKNIGTGNDTIQLSAQNYSTWITFSKSSTTLAPDQSDNITITITVPSKPLPTKGDYQIGILAKSIGNESVTANMTLVMTIKQVYGVEVNSNVSVSYVDPGQSVSYNITVKNTGNGQDSFSLTKSGDHTDWVTFSSSSITVDGLQSSSVSMLVQVPSNAFAQSFVVKVNVKSQGDATIQQNLSLTTTINLLYGLELTPSETSKEITSAISATYNMTIRNTGNSNDTMEFEAVGARMDWVAFNVTSVLLGPGNSTTVKVTINPPWAVPYDKLTGTYVHGVKVTSRGYSFATSTVNLTTKINIVYDFDTTWDTTSKTVGPGGKATFNVTINNKGNIQDTYVLNAQTFTTWVEWNNNNVTILSASPDTIMMTVNVPSGQANGDYTVTVEVKPLGNDTKKKTTNVIVKVSELFGVSLTSEDIDKEAGQGSAITYTVKVKNTGNVNENIDLKIAEGKYKDWATLSDETTILGEKGEKLVTVTLRVPDDQAAGNYDVTLKAEVRGHTEYTANLVLSTLLQYGVEVTTKEAKKKGKANDLITFNVTVKNKGTGNDTFDLSLVDPNSDWLVSFDYDNFELAKDKSKLVLVTLRIDKNALMQQYPISFKAQSDGDSTKTAVMTLTVDVESTSSLTLESTDMDQKARPGMTIVYTFRLTNEGNGLDIYNLKIQDGDNSNWATVSKETTSVASKQFEELTVTVTLPNDAPAGYYNHTIKVWVKDEDAISQMMTFKTQVEAVYSFQISAEEASLDGEPGDSVAYLLKVENTGNALDTYDLQVKDLPSMWTYEVSLGTLSVGPKSKTTFTFTVFISGDYAKAKADSYSFSVRLTSIGNDTIEKTLAITTVVKQVYGLELNAEQGVIRDTIDPYGDDQDFTLNVKNIGNGEDTVTFKIKQYPAGWSTSYFTFSPTALTVLPGNTTTKQVLVKVSASSIDADVGTYDFTVVAMSKDGNEYAPTKLTLEVIKGNVATLNKADITFAKTNVNKGDTVSVTVTIRNDGNSDMRNVIVQLYANGNSVASKTITATIKKNADAQTTLEWTTDTAGTNTMKVTAKYGTETVKELSLTQKVTVGEKSTALGIDMTWLIIGLLLVVVVGVIVWAVRRKPAPAPMPMARPPAPRPVTPPAVKKPLDEDEDEDAEDALDKGAPPKPPVPPPAIGAPEARPKIARIKCPKCQTVKDVTSPVRPIEVKCDNCGARLRLVK